MPENTQSGKSIDIAGETYLADEVAAAKKALEIRAKNAPAWEAGAWDNAAESAWALFQLLQSYPQETASRGYAKNKPVIGSEPPVFKAAGPRSAAYREFADAARARAALLQSQGGGWVSPQNGPVRAPPLDLGGGGLPPPPGPQLGGELPGPTEGQQTAGKVAMVVGWGALLAGIVYALTRAGR